MFTVLSGDGTFVEDRERVAGNGRLRWSGASPNAPSFFPLGVFERRSGALAGGFASRLSDPAIGACARTGWPLDTYFRAMVALPPLKTGHDAR